MSPGRLKRPWQGKVEKQPQSILPKYDPACYLCPGNERVNGERNPGYKGTFVFVNDFSALSLGEKAFTINEEGLICAEGERGLCKVVCFSPRHDLTLAEMKVKDIYNLVRVWKEEYTSLGSMDAVNYVQIFENKGEMMGCSNPHPHCQIWAENSVPVEPAKEGKQFLEYVDQTGSCILCDYSSLELKKKARVVFETKRFVAIVPFWAVWPFEILLMPRKHLSHLTAMTEEDLRDFTTALKKITVRYDNLFEISFPYSAGIHQSPTDGREHDEWHLHMHFYPPLLRSAGVRKFMVGYEMLANPQRDLTAESAAERLRGIPDLDFKDR